jgi:hypothetical protein
MKESSSTLKSLYLMPIMPMISSLFPFLFFSRDPLYLAANFIQRGPLYIPEDANESPGLITGKHASLSCNNKTKVTSLGLKKKGTSRT